MTVIKVCGLTDMEIALGVSKLGTDIIGMVFAPSKRQVTFKQAAGIVKAVKQLPASPAVAGVFVNEPVTYVNGIADYCGLDIIQLSGNENWDYCQKINRPFIKVIHVGQGSSSTQVITEIETGEKSRYEHPFVCMLDCKSDDSYGGTGHSFNWDIAAACSHLSIMIAGGLSPLNVRQLIRKACPAGVDVSSGVENNGKKDLAKVADFIRAVRLTAGANRNVSERLRSILCKGERYATR